MPGKPRALILAPTRELVGQIEQALIPLAATAGLTTRTVFGGVGQHPQVQGLRRGVDIVVACPGRLEDLIQQGHCDLGAVEVTVLDEADHMADLGFLPAVRRLLAATPKQGQRLLFSATLDRGVNVLVKQFLQQPVTHEADSAQSPVTAMDHHVLHLSREQRVPVLVDLTSAPGRTMVFTRTKHGAKALARQLNRSGVPTVELHGNLSQGARTRNMDAFHAGRATTMVATDIAARGIHVDDIALVVHADPPSEHKAYLHRSGRTARAGAAGTVITLMTEDQVRDVRDLDPGGRHQADHHPRRRPAAPDAHHARPRRAGPRGRWPRRHRRGARAPVRWRSQPWPLRWPAPLGGSRPGRPAARSREPAALAVASVVGRAPRSRLRPAASRRAVATATAVAAASRSRLRRRHAQRARRSAPAAADGPLLGSAR